MRLLVAAHNLGIGGSQLNAIDLAAGAAAAGHEVAVYGPRGPLVDRIEARGLEYVPARPLRYRPAPSRIAQLALLARRRKLDLIHAYEWPPCLDAYYGAHLGFGVPLVCTVLSMSVSPLVPPSIPLIMGTEDLGREARRAHDAPVCVLEPPIDTGLDHPGIDGRAFRREHGVPDDAPLVVTVSRLSLELKLDALVRAIDAVGHLAGRRDVRLVIAGGGPAEEALRVRADRVNRQWGREVVRFAGLVQDPRSAYAAADVVVGMGSSALRAMSIGRPVVVQGERGFSEIFEPDTRDRFLRTGFWGVGDDPPTARLLAGQIHALLSNAARRAELGAFGRRTVEERFSLERAVGRQLEIYEQVLRAEPKPRVAQAATAARRALGIELRAHDPRRKRERRELEQSLLAAARRPPEAAAPPVPEAGRGAREAPGAARPDIPASSRPAIPAAETVS
jgi:L-malate glycosyltransferase